MSELRIVKVGGSLLALHDLPLRLTTWLNRQPPATNVLLAGGGVLTDAVRAWDERFALGEEHSHWLCVDLLDVTAQLLHGLLTDSQLCKDWRLIADYPVALSPVVFAPARFLREEEHLLPGRPLPHTWATTSDSIAARLAEITKAAELVLLKSVPPLVGGLDTLASGYVDQGFVEAARCVPRVRFVDLCTNPTQ
jgi:aspartokinase-like uncharacterized kinase